MMRMWRMCLGCVVVLSLMWSGCSRGAKSSATQADALPMLLNPSIAATSVVARVNGTDFTRADFERHLALRDRSFRLKQGLPLTGKVKKAHDYLRRTCRLLFSELLCRELVRQEAEKRGFAPTEEQMASARAAYMRGIKKGGTPFAKYLATLSAPDRAYLERQLRVDVLGERLLDAMATNDFRQVTMEEITNRIAAVRQTQREAAEKNAEARRKAAAAKAEIMAGASFYAVTTNRAEIFKDEGKYWDCIELAELEPEDDLLKFLIGAKAGDISDPMDFNDGIGIVGVLEKKMTPPEKPGDKPTAEYLLVRCVFNGYEPVNEPETIPEMRKLLLERKREAAQNQVLHELLAKAKVEYPLGKKLWELPKKRSLKGKTPAVKKAKGISKKTSATKSAKIKSAPVDKEAP